MSEQNHTHRRKSTTCLQANKSGLRVGGGGIHFKPGRVDKGSEQGKYSVYATKQKEKEDVNKNLYRLARRPDEGC